MTISQKLLTFSCFTLACVSPIRASETCKPLPSCASLGYTQTSCPSNRAALKCPFDTGKVYCAASATTDCKVGSIYYSDDTCSESRINSKTPIGVVFDAVNRLVVSLVETQKGWDGYGTDVPQLLNFEDSNAVKTDVNGKSNTDILVSFGDYPAAQYCHDMTTGGKTWYLPAFAEMQPMCNSVVNSTLAVVGTGLSNNFYWSSTEYGHYHAWVFLPISGGSSYYTKSNPGYVRCVFAF